MFGFIIDFFRRRALRRHQSQTPTGLLPLSQIKAYMAIVDVEEYSSDCCKTDIINYFRKAGIKGSIFFRDFRKISSEDRLITSIQTTINRKDLNWFGRPSDYKMGVMEEQKPDLLLCLIKDMDFPMEYLVRASKARFKIGRSQTGGNAFDFVASDPEGKSYSQLEAFQGIKKYLETIR